MDGAAEGPNTLAFRAVDAAGNRTDSTRTVIRDTQAPVVTLNSLPDSATVRADSAVTVSGTITNLTKVTANVNGQPLAIDSVTHAFSQRITLSTGMNFVTVTATDAAGNATSVVRQVTVDNTPPTLTLTGPGEGLVTKELVAHVTGTASASSAVTVKVNGPLIGLVSTKAVVEFNAFKKLVASSHPLLAWLQIVDERQFHHPRVLHFQPWPGYSPPAGHMTASEQEVSR